ncbi:hypothetical protein, variant [Phialophora macrospora]|nr:hypothetical protein, variant [Phialophora macrospora]
MEGEKLKKKLNGSILKGRKIKIEEARPKKRRRFEASEEDATEEEPEATTPVKAKNSKKEHNVITGHELPAVRKVKRGWTEARSTRSSKKDKTKPQSTTSKYTDKDELLFRTKLPANKSDLGTAKKEKGKSKKMKNGDHTVQVHEFEKSTLQPSFLKQEVGLGIKGNLQYVEGQGWLDDSGQVVEDEKPRAAKLREIAKSQPQSKREPAKEPDESSATSSSSSDDDDSYEGKDVSKPTEVDSDDETSTSGSSSSSESAEEIHEGTLPRTTFDFVETNGPEVHPLEALFKKPNKPASQDIAKPSLEIATSFSFLDAQEADDFEDEDAVVPMTPFSSQEYRSRGLRSAAPTPDTAHPSRFNSYGSSGLPGDEDMEEDEEQQTYEPSSKKQPAETSLRTPSEFEKKFWENRADNNRAWKLRRRTVLKEKRQRENKARRPQHW